uniref:HECT domain-containing protein n=1 Tax=Macrostomum lignano TaxID=282301 RepID=A0A1I8FLV5_9PLAT
VAPRAGLRAPHLVIGSLNARSDPRCWPRQPSRSAATPRSALAAPLLSARQPRRLLGRRPRDESEEDASDAVGDGGSSSAPACCRLVWLSMAELAAGLGRLARALTPIQRRCLLGQLHFLAELRLAALVAEQPGGGDDGGRDSEAGGLGLLLRMIRRAQTLGLGSGRCYEGAEAFQARATPTWTCRHRISGRLGCCSAMASCSDASADQLDSGLQLVIRLLEVLQILVQAHARARRQQSTSRRGVNHFSVGHWPVSSGCRPGRRSDARRRWPSQRAGRSDSAAGGAQLRPGRVRSELPVRPPWACCAAFAAWPQPAPPPAAAASLTSWSAAGFCGRADRHSEELWRGLVGSVLPAYARCNPSSVPLLAAAAVQPTRTCRASRRPEVFAQLVESVGTGAHLWALLLLLNRRARSLQQQRRKRRQPPSQQQRLSESEDGDADGQFEPPTRPTADCQPSVSISEDRRRRQQLSSSSRQQFDSPRLQRCWAEFAVLRAAAGLRRPHPLPAAPHRSSILRRLTNSAATNIFGFDELDEELESALLPATAAAAEELPAQLESALNFVGAHLSRRDASGGGMGRSRELWAAAMTQAVRGFSQRVAMGNRAPSNQQQGRHLASLCVRTIERGRGRRCRCFNSCGSSAACWPGQEACGGPHLRLASWSRLLGASEPKLVLNFCLGIAASSSCLPPPLLPTSTADSNSGSSSSSRQLGIIRLCTAGCSPSQSSSSASRALPLVARLVPKLLPRLRPTVADQRPPGVVLLASFAFLQQCTVTMVDLMVRVPGTAAAVTLRPKLRSVLSSVARGVHPRPAAACTAGLPQAAPPAAAALASREHWRRLLRLNLEMTVASEAANRLEEDDSDSADAAGSLADFEAELLLGNVFGSGEEDADGDSGTDDDGSESSGTESEEEGRAAQRIRPRGRLVAQLAACLAPLPPATRAMLLQSLQRPACRGWPACCASWTRRSTRPPCWSSPARDSQQLGRAGSCPAGCWPAWPPCSKRPAAPRASAWTCWTASARCWSTLAAAADPAERLLDCLAAYAQGSSEDEAAAEAPGAPPVRAAAAGTPMAPSGWPRCARFSACWTALATSSSTVWPPTACPPLPSSPRTDSEEVERLAQRLLADIEQRAGEPLELQPFTQTLPPPISAASQIPQLPIRSSNFQKAFLEPFRSDQLKKMQQHHMHLHDADQVQQHPHAADAAPANASSPSPGCPCARRPAVERKRKFNGAAAPASRTRPAAWSLLARFPATLRPRNAAQDFGKVQLIFPMPAKHQALVEYLRLADAERLIAYHHSGPGVNIKAPTALPQHRPQNCLLLTIYNMKMEFNCTDVRQICSPYAIIERCVIIKQQDGLTRAIVEFERLEDAALAKPFLNGANMYTNWQCHPLRLRQGQRFRVLYVQ